LQSFFWGEGGEISKRERKEKRKMRRWEYVEEKANAGGKSVEAESEPDKLK
jgi:hypothetical protein